MNADERKKARLESVTTSLQASPEFTTSIRPRSAPQNAGQSLRRTATLSPGRYRLAVQKRPRKGFPWTSKMVRQLA